MKRILAIAGATVVIAAAGQAQTIVSDDYAVTGNGTGFALDTGVNTGSAVSSLRYYQTATGNAGTAYSITGGTGGDECRTRGHKSCSSFEPSAP